MGPLDAAAVLIGAFTLLSGCTQAAAPPAADARAAQPAQSSILVSSAPAAGSTVRGPVDELMLHFNPPARLHELTVTGPDGTMPMMVHAVAEVAHYSVPTSGLGPGSYTVKWRATSGGREYQGTFPFTVR